MWWFRRLFPFVVPHQGALVHPGKNANGLSPHYHWFLLACHRCDGLVERLFWHRALFVTIPHSICTQWPTTAYHFAIWRCSYSRCRPHESNIPGLGSCCCFLYHISKPPWPLDFATEPLTSGSEPLPVCRAWNQFDQVSPTKVPCFSLSFFAQVSISKPS